MKLVRLSSSPTLDNLSTIIEDIPVAGPGEVLVRWRATSLNFHDYLVANGSIPVNEGQIPMSDGAGEVAAVGEGVSQWKQGDKVLSLFFPNWLAGKATHNATKFISGETSEGFATEYSLVKETSLTKMPENYTFAEAATLPCAALTAWRALIVEGQIKAGDSVLVEGSGGMSIFALQFARAAGAHVIATTSNGEKAERLQELGADHVINYREDEHWGKTAFKLSGGIDHVLDVGGGSTLAQSVEAVGFAGKISLIGILGGRKADFVLPKLFFKHASMNGIAVANRQDQENMVKALPRLNFKPIIDENFTLDEIGNAFKYQESGRHFGKIVVEF